MYSRSTGLYDMIHCGLKDYEREAAELAEAIRSRCPEATSVLDVACGTGEHARFLSRQHGFQVDGVDLEPDLVRRAAAKNPSGRFVRADMRDLHLGRTYDAVLCLFGAIGYAGTVEGLHRACAALRQHLADDGVVVVEPWFEPSVIEAGRVDLVTAENARLKVCRMSRLEVQGRRSRIHFEYLVGRADGIAHEQETHELGLFSRQEILEAFALAGLEATFLQRWIGSRGAYVARRAEGSGVPARSG